MADVIQVDHVAPPDRVGAATVLTAAAAFQFGASAVALFDRQLHQLTHTITVNDLEDVPE